MTFIIHQIFIDIGKGATFRDNELYSRIYDNNRKYYSIMIWNEERLDLLILKYPEFIDLYNSFPNKFYKIDFMRPLILHQYGGVYLDMDNELEAPIEFVDRKYEGEAFNDVLYWSNRDLYLEYARFMKERYMRCRMSKTWVCRRFMYSVGQRSYDQFCKKKGIDRGVVCKYKGWNSQMWLKYMRPNSKIKPFVREIN
jgi:hypothetical protein